MSNIANKGLLLIISSPSGAGKTTICRKLIDEVDDIDLSVSVTTRKKRKDEIEGKHYFFKNENEFRILLKENQFLEHANVFGCLYGTLKQEVVLKINKGIDVIVDIDWQGTRQIRNKKLKYKLLTIYILPPSKKELLRRLNKREKKNLKTVKKRMKEFKKDLSRWKEYDFVVINDNLKSCYKKIMSIIKSNKKFSFDRNFINKHVKSLMI